MNLPPIIRPLTVMAIFSVLAIFVSDWFYIMVIIMAFDVRSRYTDYLEYRNKKWSRKMGMRFQRSFCSRGVAMHIWGRPAREYFREQGYRCYHILPDEFPFILTKKRFWKSVFEL